MVRQQCSINAEIPISAELSLLKSANENNSLVFISELTAYIQQTHEKYIRYRSQLILSASLEAALPVHLGSTWNELSRCQSHMDQSNRLRMAERTQKTKAEAIV